MRQPDEQKRDAIIRVGAKLFATRPFHEVRLEDVATKARIGKGTLYLYFTSKEDLYHSIIHEAIDGLVARLEQKVFERSYSAWDRLRIIVQELMDFARAHSHVFQLLQTVDFRDTVDSAVHKRPKLTALFVAVLRQGVQSGELSDPHPELTAQLVLSFARAAVRNGGAEAKREVVLNHILGILGQGVLRKDSKGHVCGGHGSQPSA